MYWLCYLIIFFTIIVLLADVHFTTFIIFYTLVKVLGCCFRCCVVDGLAVVVFAIVDDFDAASNVGIDVVAVAVEVDVVIVVVVVVDVELLVEAAAVCAVVVVLAVV